MDAKQFFSKVCAMRKAQKAFFQTRDAAALRQSKALEKEIDDEIARESRTNPTFSHSSRNHNSIIGNFKTD